MKKLIVLLFVVVMFSACNSQAKVTNKGIPTDYETLQFYNGSGLIGDYKDVSMKVEIITSTKIVGANVYFYKYHVYNHEQTIDDYIIDSEALAIKYTVSESE